MFVDRPILNPDLGWYEREFGMSSGDEPVERAVYRIDRACHWSFTSVDHDTEWVVNRFGKERVAEPPTRRYYTKLGDVAPKALAGEQPEIATKKNASVSGKNKYQRACNPVRPALTPEQIALKESYSRAVRRAVRLDLWGLPYKFPSCHEHGIGCELAVEICESEGKSVRVEYGIEEWPYVIKEHVTRQVAFTRLHLQFLLGRCDAPSGSSFGLSRKESASIVKHCGEVIKKPSPWHPPESD